MQLLLDQMSIEKFTVYQIGCDRTRDLEDLPKELGGQEHPTLSFRDWRSTSGLFTEFIITQAFVRLQDPEEGIDQLKD